LSTTKLTESIIEAAIVGFESQKKSIDQQINQLRAMLTGTPESATEAKPAPRKRRKFSAAARKRMRDAQRLRWAKIKDQAEPAAKSIKPARRISAAGRKAIAEAMRKRWAAKRAAQSGSTPAAKKTARQAA